MRYFLFLLLTAILVACTAEVSQEPPSPVAISIETLPPAGADTPTETATLPPTDSPTETATPLPTFNHTLETKTFVPTDISVASSWSPDGSKLVFTARFIDESQGTFLLDLPTWEITRIMEQQSLPIWSSDGSQLAFGFLEESRARLLIWNENNQQMTNILEMENIYRFYVIS